MGGPCDEPRPHDAGALSFRFGRGTLARGRRTGNRPCLDCGSGSDDHHANYDARIGAEPLA